MNSSAITNFLGLTYPPPHLPYFYVKVIDLKFSMEVLTDGHDVREYIRDKLLEIIHSDYFDENYDLDYRIYRRPIDQSSDPYGMQSKCRVKGYILFGDEIDYMQYKVSGREFPSYTHMEVESVYKNYDKVVRFF